MWYTFWTLLVVAYAMYYRAGVLYDAMTRECGLPYEAVSFGANQFPWKLFRHNAFGESLEAKRKQALRYFLASNVGVAAAGVLASSWGGGR
jgi:hypothetical protein